MTQKLLFYIFIPIRSYIPRYHGDMDIPKGKTIEDAQQKEAERYLPSSVRTLRSRWKPGMNFGAFSDATFASFY